MDAKAQPPLWWEDFKAGEVVEMGRHIFTERDIVEFARQFDPQPFHTDEAAARRTIYGGLLASGWHTAAIVMRLLWDTVLKDAASLGSPGVDEVRWLKPVRPGDTLRARFTVTGARPSSRRPDRGVVHSLSEVFNQHGELVMTIRGLGLYARRPA